MPSAAALLVEADCGRRATIIQPLPEERIVVQVAAASEFPNMAGIRRRHRALPLETLDPVPSVRFHSLRGNELDSLMAQTPSINGKPLDYEHWPLFGGPFVEAAVDSEQLLIKYGEMRRSWISAR